MRVALVGDELIPDVGGVPVYTAGLSSALAELGIDVELITHWHQSQLQEEEIQGVKIKRLKGFVLPRFNRALSPLLFFRLHREIKWGKYDVVHSLDLYSSMGCQSMWTAKRNGIPSIFTCHTTCEPSPQILLAHAPMLKFAKLARAKGVIAVSDSAKEFCVGLGIDESKIFVVPNGIDLSLFGPKEGGKRLREKLGVKSGPLIVTASRLTRRKGIHRLIEAFADVVKKFPSAKLTIAGAGAELDRLQRLSKKIGVEKSVAFIGPFPHPKMPELLSAADVCVLPSKVETFSFLALESLATGTPFIGPNSGVIASIIRHEESGLLVPTSDVEALSRAIIRLLDDKKLQKRLKRNGLRLVRKNFSWEACAKKTLGVYEIVVRQRE